MSTVASESTFHRLETKVGTRATCLEFGVQYLVATVYDTAWKHRDGWVWTLPVVVADPEFRALDCR
jgi:hypothetical protein